MNVLIQPPSVDSKTYFELEQTQCIPNKALYEKFLNWVSGEFELYLQDNLHGLQIFFPGGWVYITNIETTPNNIVFNILVKSKFQQKGIQINNQINAILEHVLKLKRPSISLKPFN